ncbi:hypothetical protein F-liban_344 [Faustovirus]|nr:hypothetical protein F-liban_344 [Faustovirus]SME65031.1 Hypothetical protein FSTVST1_334 [Faustovirus ST1]
MSRHQCSKCLGKRYFESEIEDLNAKKRNAKDHSDICTFIGTVTGFTGLALKSANWFQLSIGKVCSEIYPSDDHRGLILFRNYKRVRSMFVASGVMLLGSAAAFIEAYSSRRRAKQYKYQIKQLL